jgi:hypothetical protein
MDCLYHRTFFGSAGQKMGQLRIPCRIGQRMIGWDSISILKSRGLLSIAWPIVVVTVLHATTTGVLIEFPGLCVKL